MSVIHCFFTFLLCSSVGSGRLLGYKDWVGASWRASPAGLQVVSAGGRRLTVEAGQAGHCAGQGQVGAAAGQPLPLGISVGKFTIRFS